MIGWSAGLTFWYTGGLGMSLGSWEAVLAIADWTSWAAASSCRLRLNCSVTCVDPSALVEVIEASAAMVGDCRSSGGAAGAALGEGRGPGSDAVTWMVGKS